MASRASTMALKLLMRSIRRGNCDAPSKWSTPKSSLNSIHHLFTYFVILLPPFRLINHVMKQGSGTANTLGTLAVLYSACGVLLQYIRDQDDNVNTIIAGSATGLLYKSTGESIPPMNKTLNTQSFIDSFSWPSKMCSRWCYWFGHLVALLLIPAGTRKHQHKLKSKIPVGEETIEPLNRL